MSTIARRRSSRDAEPAEERPARRGRRSSEEEPEERSTSRRRSREPEDEPAEETTTRRGRRSSREEEPEDKPARRGRRSGGDDEDKPARGRGSRRGGSGGFSSYSQKKRSNSDFADEFKPSGDAPVLFKILDEEPFDVYNQHWVEEGKAAGKTRHSFVCRAYDEYFDDQEDWDEGDETAECPLCDLGESASTMSLFNVIDLSDPRKPQVKVWRTTPSITEILERASKEKKTSPLNREDLYWEVTVTKTKNKTTYQIVPVKARDLGEDYDIDPLDDNEIEDFEKDRFKDRTAVTKVDSLEELEELADSIE